VLNERLTQLKKDGGESTAAAAELRRRLAEESAVRTDTKKRLDEVLEGGVPVAPTNPAMRRPGTVYKAPSGVGFVKWNGTAWEAAPAPASPNAAVRAVEGVGRGMKSTFGSALRLLGVGTDEEADDGDDEDSD